MTKMCSLVSKVPLTSLRKVRSTCKEWNTLSKRRSFVKKHLGQASVGAATHKLEGKLISGSDEVDISRVFHCDGLLSFIPKGITRLVVCNPYLGQPVLSNPLSIFATGGTIRMLSGTRRAAAASTLT
ncbi:hypothetical protein BRARA_C04038 [Brassica rapa]|uniref:F-box associated beta-propeller type 1 domain-containing protein n=1 Tax=Brassica campestris TaxID=3711 RepID=A0A398A2U4_BRACM|nr:hypothetical protein BRARA_C04038 [Brassica rapa]